ncbi:iron-sulfur cluster insertion protein ErpA [uncultured Gammaproteobacteria bacterium]
MTELACGRTLSVTEAAARHIVEVVARENNPALMLRLSVSGGGCAGFRYGFTLDDSRNADDITVERQGAKVVIDPGSLDLLAGATLDFNEDLMGTSFRVVNPNALSSCGCGASFGA